MLEGGRPTEGEIAQQLDAINYVAVPNETDGQQPAAIDNAAQSTERPKPSLRDQFHTQFEGLLSGELVPTPAQLEQYADTLIKLGQEGSEQDQEKFHLEIKGARNLRGILNGDIKSVPELAVRMMRVMSARRPFSIEKYVAQARLEDKLHGKPVLQSEEELRTRIANADKVLNVINTVASAFVPEAELQKLNTQTSGSETA